MSTRKDVFVGIQEAMLRVPINVHRMQQLSSRVGGLYEETITDILLNEMIGEPYSISANCQQCSSEDCAHWGGGRATPDVGAKAKPLTKYEEGGNSRHGVAPSGADWVLSVTQGTEYVDIMVQAKAGRLPASVNEKRQLKALLNAAHDLNAAPFYVIYLKHEDPHALLETLCQWRTSAAETSMLVLSAFTVQELSPRTPIVEWALRARPLSCLGGCPCLKTGKSDAFAAILKFARSFVPEYSPVKRLEPLDVPGVRTLSIETATQSLPRRRRKPLVGRQVDAAVVVRLGNPGWKDDGVEGSQRKIGFHSDPPLSADELRDATRMYWRMAKDRAESVQYLVASHRGEVHGIYKVSDGDSVITHNGRIKFEVHEIQLESAIGRSVHRVAEARLKEVSGSQAPFVYADL